ncbi:hypothetical protein TRFO_11653 [Tritrichomonas foetus]|uniref:Uncharacterized protein n=1 Tax=Tritrichomonas foetus TaxID=1144522 RepID=A0A1J4J8C1_9EUKA|nr:hypothetical protein TRFO_11653 [Tritrichomonas foetus]|eukprot:OHS93653.1 hypothetical protein TRFO_11653 [Tritrichomonas foetus]
MTIKNLEFNYFGIVTSLFFPSFGITRTTNTRVKMSEMCGTYDEIDFYDPYGYSDYSTDEDAKVIYYVSQPAPDPNTGINTHIIDSISHHNVSFPKKTQSKSTHSNIILLSNISQNNEAKDKNTDSSSTNSYENRSNQQIQSNSHKYIASSTEPFSADMLSSTTEEGPEQCSLAARNAQACPPMTVAEVLQQTINLKNISRSLLARIVDMFNSTYNLQIKLTRTEKRVKDKIVPALERYSAEILSLLQDINVKRNVVYVAYIYLAQSKDAANKPRMHTVFERYRYFLNLKNTNKTQNYV